MLSFARQTMPENPPDALLLLTPQCPHCPSLLAALTELLKRGALGRLEAVNLQARPEVAARWGARSVPWLRLGPFQLGGALTPGELETWVRRATDPEGENLAEAFHDLLKNGAAGQVLELVLEKPARLDALLPIVANPEASLNVRLGAGMVFEEVAGQGGLSPLLPELVRLAGHEDARVRADVAHLLGMCPAAEARRPLDGLAGDPDPDVREIAIESLTALGDPDQGAK